MSNSCRDKLENAEKLSRNEIDTKNRKIVNEVESSGNINCF